MRVVCAWGRASPAEGQGEQWTGETPCHDPGLSDPLGRTRRGLPPPGLTVQHSQALGSCLCPGSERSRFREPEAQGLRGRG